MQQAPSWHSGAQHGIQATIRLSHAVLRSCMADSSEECSAGGKTQGGTWQAQHGVSLTNILYYYVQGNLWGGGGVWLHL